MAKKTTTKRKTTTKTTPKKTNRLIEFDLTQTEIAECAQRAATVSKDLNDTIVEAKRVTSDYQARIKTKAAERDTLLRAINLGKIKREVEVLEMRNFEANTVEFFFEGTKVDERPMVEQDRQETLPLDTKPTTRNWVRDGKKLAANDRDDVHADA